MVPVNARAAASDNRGARLCESRTNFDGRLCERIHHTHCVFSIEILVSHHLNHAQQGRNVRSRQFCLTIQPFWYLRARWKQQSAQNDKNPPLKPRLPRTLCKPFAGMGVRTQLHNRVYFRSCSRACIRAAAISMICFTIASQEPRFSPRRKRVDRLGGFVASTA
jgi:hypothetical protein